MSKTYGYARCSTNEDKQDINRQIRELKAAGADEVIFEYEHGDAVVKQQLQSLLDAAQEGDTIITLEVSRLTRSTQQLCEIVNVIKQKRLRLVIVGSITVDCRTGQIDPMLSSRFQRVGSDAATIQARASCNAVPTTGPAMHGLASLPLRHSLGKISHTNRKCAIRNLLQVKSWTREAPPWRRSPFHTTVLCAIHSCRSFLQLLEELQICELIDIIREKRLRLVIMGSITIDCREGKADPMSEAFL